MAIDVLGAGSSLVTIVVAKDKLREVTARVTKWATRRTTLPSNPSLQLTYKDSKMTLILSASDVDERVLESVNDLLETARGGGEQPSA